METCRGRSLPIESEFSSLYLLYMDSKSYGTAPSHSYHAPVMSTHRAFEDITRDKTLVIGRKTLLLEGGDTGHFHHVAHCRRVVVVSRTLQPHDVKQFKTSQAQLPCFDVASSVEEAIRLAQEQNNNAASADTAEQVASCSSSSAMSLPKSWRNLDCWIGGGEDIYATALNLPQAQFLHLTVLDLHVPTSTAKTTHVARFPQHWQSNYRLVEQKSHSARDPVSFVTCLYTRI